MRPVSVLPLAALLAVSGRAAAAGPAASAAKSRPELAPDETNVSPSETASLETKSPQTAPDPASPEAALGPDIAPQPLVSTDSPGFTNTTQPAPELTLITEQSVGLAFPKGAPSLTIPQVLGRFGVAKFLELRAFLPSAVVQFPKGGHTTADVDHLGLGVLAGGALAPRLSGSATPVVYVPIGDDGVGAQRVEGFLQGTLSWSITDTLGLDLGALGGWVQQRNGRGALKPRGRFLGGALVSVAPVRVVSLFAQSYVECIAGDCEPVAGGGAAWWIIPPVQVHIEADTGIGRGSPPPSLSLGSVVRWW